jgi:hypothetical protein
MPDEQREIGIASCFQEAARWPETSGKYRVFNDCAKRMVEDADRITALEAEVANLRGLLHEIAMWDAPLADYGEYHLNRGLSVGLRATLYETLEKKP